MRDRQPGFPLGTRGFPSPPCDGFGLTVTLMSLIQRICEMGENPSIHFMEPMRAFWVLLNRSDKYPITKSNLFLMLLCQTIVKSSWQSNKSFATFSLSDRCRSAHWLCISSLYPIDLTSLRLRILPGWLLITPAILP